LLIIFALASVIIYHIVVVKMAPKLPDPSSFSDSSKIITKSLHLALTANLEAGVLSGYADIEISRVEPGAQTLVLDSKDLDISSIESSGSQLEYSVGDKVGDFGSPLTITLLPTSDRVRVHYKTSPSASGIQVLQPEQTLGKRHRYLFTQNQAIHARSVLPCQDTPGVKAVYTAAITVQSPLVAVMSAVPVKDEVKDGQRVFHFEQKIPIPAYLIALVVGDITSEDISPRVRVWSEKENIAECKREFEDTDSILQAAEAVAGPYVWGRYDLLVLPPSFPYGGMENPCLTFVTPTLLAGDKSLVNVVAHEIAHSWTGNLVTNANWEHFWLNEGFTVFLERKILGALATSKGKDGEKLRSFCALAGLEALNYSIEVFGADNTLTALNTELEGIDPDDAFSSVPYEKGFTLLMYLESLVGGHEVFDPFLRSYIQQFAYKSIKSQDFIDYFTKHFPAVGESIDWSKKLKEVGMPSDIADYNRELLTECENVAERWSSGSIAPDDLVKLSPKQIVTALQLVVDSKSFDMSHIKELDATFGFGSSDNSEIIFRWCRLNIRARNDSIVAPALKFVTEQGRMKYVRPIYRDLLQWDQYRDHVIETFRQYKGFYHNICSNMVEKDIAAQLSKV